MRSIGATRGTGTGELKVTGESKNAILSIVVLEVSNNTK